MRLPARRFISVKSIYLLLLTAIPLVLGGCSGTWGAMWGEQAGGGGSQLASAGAASGETVRTGSISSRLISGTVAIIAAHDSSEHQRRLAAKRAVAWMAQHPATAQGGHYIAVDTEPDGLGSPRAQKSIIIFDTETRKIVGAHVYDIPAPPPVGSIMRFGHYPARYIGAGL